MNFYIQIAIIVLFTGSLTNADDAFGYDKTQQTKWSARYKACCGNLQSPIPIVSSCAVPTPMSPIKFKRYGEQLPLVLTNNGHTVTLSICPKKLHCACVPSICGGPLKNEYEFHEINFHWGDRKCVGSEHTLDGVTYSMEMHIVHKNKKYQTVAEAMNCADGFAVLAFFFRISDKGCDDKLEQLVKYLPQICKPNQRFPLPEGCSLTLESLLPSQKCMEIFYTYQGSVTTPPCSESVTWIVFKNTRAISNAQINKFRSLYASDGCSKLVNNFRVLQKTCGRKVMVRSLKPKCENNNNACSGGSNLG